MVDTLKDEIKAYAKTIGIQKIGFTTADYFQTLEKRLSFAQEHDLLTGFEHPVIAERVNPSLIFEQPQSIIAIALAYPNQMDNTLRSKRGEWRGVFARASWGVDYHTVLREKLALLEAFIKTKVPEARTKSMVDTGELSDVAVAERAGIGWRGKNTLLITPEYGSFVYLGEMITNIAFEPDEPMGDQCGECTQCIKACPTGALLGDGKMNGKECLSYQTQTKGMMPERFRDKLHNRLYGCDTCQVVCPYNRGKDFHLHPAMEPDEAKVKPLLKPLLTISNREFKETFGPMAGSWRGKKPLQRNAILILGRYKDETAIPDLVNCLLADPRPVIRGTAAYALAKIGGHIALEALQTAQQEETDDEARAEITAALLNLSQKEG
ncbi:tRNA epoxyqueuosine(34) reductase QueG [Brochothrix campestris]|uniref:YhbA protein n=1 Tax=Brochothrix campestris FSL F6-1037 TaxID=1265861 RepID=W7CNV3_9LIST|nr:tRNA epoxyqueuosine(34) reductase QueG [Brochothrix campestris]EUJ38360.1 YhbA protein [Brochothrix campestris FSL F6-1037]